jgi:hypothetical protein
MIEKHVIAIEEFAVLRLSGGSKCLATSNFFPKVKISKKTILSVRLSNIYNIV